MLGTVTVPCLISRLTWNMTICNFNIGYLAEVLQVFAETITFSIQAEPVKIPPEILQTSKLQSSIL